MLSNLTDDGFIKSMLESLCFSKDESILCMLGDDVAFEMACDMMSGISTTDSDVDAVHLAWLTPAITYVISSDYAKSEELYEKVFHLVEEEMKKYKEMVELRFECLCHILANKRASKLHAQSSQLLEIEIMRMPKYSEECQSRMLNSIWKAAQTCGSEECCRLTLFVLGICQREFTNLEEILKNISEMKKGAKIFETFAYGSLETLLNGSNEPFVVKCFQILWKMLPMEKTLNNLIKIMEGSYEESLLVNTAPLQALIPMFAEYIFHRQNFRRSLDIIIRLFEVNTDKRWTNVLEKFIVANCREGDYASVLLIGINRLLARQPTAMRKVAETLINHVEFVAEAQALLSVLNCLLICNTNKVSVEYSFDSPLWFMMPNMKNLVAAGIPDLQVVLFRALAHPEEFDEISKYFSVNSQSSALVFIELASKVNMSKETRQKMRSIANIEGELAEIVRLACDFYPLTEFDEITQQQDVVGYQTTDFLISFARKNDKIGMTLRSMISNITFELDVDESMRSMPISAIAPSMIVNLGLALPDNRFNLKMIQKRQSEAVVQFDDSYKLPEFHVGVIRFTAGSKSLFEVTEKVSPDFAEFYSDIGNSGLSKNTACTNTQFVRLVFDTVFNQGDLSMCCCLILFNETGRRINPKMCNTNADIVYSVAMIDDFYVLTPLKVPDEYLSITVGSDLLIKKQDLKHAILSMLYFPAIRAVKSEIRSCYENRKTLWQFMDSEGMDDIFRIVAH